MELLDINPYVRYLDKRTDVRDYAEYVMAYDYRMFYTDRGEICIDIDGAVYKIKENCLVVVPPCIKYKLSFYKDYEFTVFNFDLSVGSTQDTPLEPRTAEAFDCSQILSPSRCDLFPAVLSCDMEAKAVVNNMVHCYQNKPMLHQELLSALMKTLLVTSVMYTDYDNTPDLVKQVMEYIDKNFAESLSNRMIGEMFSYHPNYLNKLMKAFTRKSLHQYILSVRLTKAAHLLNTCDWSVSRVAGACGFDSSAYFIKKFGEKYGQTPLKFRNQRYRNL